MSNFKLQFIKEYEKKYQKQWEIERSYESDKNWDDNDKREKFYVAVPIPYLNSLLNINQGFTISKAEFVCQYKRLKGKKVLFPFGFHGTQDIVKVYCDRIKNEIELYGNPPIFPKDRLSNDKKYSYSFRNYQWEIMKSYYGIPDEEIVKFKDIEYWYSFFSNQAKQDLLNLGISIDWRRSFIVSPINKYYSSFIKWQFETLKSLNKIKYGKCYLIWSTIDNGYCEDGDRSIGEGIREKNYQLIKLKLDNISNNNSNNNIQNKLKNYNNIYLMAYTNRIELIYGITNCFISPNFEYGAFEMKNGDIYICTERSMRNMSYQDLTVCNGQYKCIVKFNGSDLIGLKVFTPSISTRHVVPILPSPYIQKDKSTGITISTPSDSTEDYSILISLKNNNNENYGNKIENLLNSIEPIINIPDYSNLIGIKLYDDYKINSNKNQIQNTNDISSFKCYYEGILMVGKYVNQKVKDVKKTIKSDLIESNDCIEYYEPESTVKTRSNDEECVVAQKEQWYFNFGDDDIDWKNQVFQQINEMQIYKEEVKKRMEQSLNFINQWSFSKRYGVGIPIPWDQNFKITSSTDSTLYSLFLTISHLLQGDAQGTIPGQLNIESDQLTNRVWDYIFLNKEYPIESSIPIESLNQIRNEFNFWYPVNLICLGKELIHNHILFFIYTNIAIFQNNKELQTQSNAQLTSTSIKINGHIKFKRTRDPSRYYSSLKDLIENYSADVTRILLADGGETIDEIWYNGNHSNILRIYNQIQWVKETIDSIDQYRDGPLSHFQDHVFSNQINKIIVESERCYENLNFRDALHLVYYQFLNINIYI